MKKLFILLILVFSCREENLDSSLLSRSDYDKAGPVDINYRGHRMTVWKDENGNYVTNEDMQLQKRDVTEGLDYTSDKALRADWDHIEAYYVEPWPKAEIDYRIDAGFSPAQAALIKQAILHWTDKTDINFTEVNSGETLLFKTAASGCSSPIGYPGPNRKNTINLSITCDLRSITHEIGHTVGLIHEHQKINRDSYLTLQPVTFDYIKNNYSISLYNLVVENLYKEETSLGDPYPFDMGSLMIYGSYPQNTFPLRTDLMSRNLPLYTKKDGSLVERPATHMLTNKDINLVNYYYSRKIILKNIDYNTIHLKIRLANTTDPATINFGPGQEIILYYNKNIQKYIYNGHVVQQLDLNNGGSSNDIDFESGKISYTKKSGARLTLIDNYKDINNTVPYHFTDRDGIDGGSKNAIIEAIQENYFNIRIHLKAWGSASKTDGKEHSFINNTVNKLVIRNINYNTLNKFKIRLEGTNDPTLSVAPGQSVNFTYDGTYFRYQGYIIQQIDLNDGGSSDDLNFLWSAYPKEVVYNAGSSSSGNLIIDTHSKYVYGATDADGIDGKSPNAQIAAYIDNNTIFLDIRK